MTNSIDRACIVWGFYRQGNFGDDLMGILLSQHLSRLGLNVYTYGLDRLNCQRNGLRSVSRISDVLATTSLLVLGGGAFLKPPTGFIRRLLSKSSRSIGAQIEELAGALENNVPTICCSIGSDGISDASEIDRRRRAVIASRTFLGGTVRLIGDVGIIQSINPNCRISYVPDILFSVPSVITPNRRRPMSVGINLSLRSRVDVRGLLLALKKNGMDPTILVSHSEESGIDSEYGSRNSPAWTADYPTIRCNDPVAFAASLSEFDAVISGKLHVGIVALAYGAAFWSLDGRGKTKAQLQELGLSGFVLTGNKSTVLEIADQVTDMARKNSITTLPNAKETIAGHLTSIGQLLGAAHICR